MGDIQRIIKYITERPILIAGLIFVGLFLYFQVIKKTPAVTSTGTATPVPTTSEQYIQSYNSYPTGGTTVIQQNAPAPKPPDKPTGIFHSKPPTPKPIPKPKPVPKPVPKPQPKPKTVTHYITVTPWNSPNSTLSGIAKSSGKTLKQIEDMNPQYKSNWNLIYSGQQVRVG